MSVNGATVNGTCIMEATQVLTADRRVNSALGSRPRLRQLRPVSPAVPSQIARAATPAIPTLRRHTGRAAASEAEGGMRRNHDWASKQEGDVLRPGRGLTFGVVTRSRGCPGRSHPCRNESRPK